MAHTKLKLPHNKLISAPEDLGLAVLKLSGSGQALFYEFPPWHSFLVAAHAAVCLPMF